MASSPEVVGLKLSFKLGERAEFSLPDLDGNDVDLSDFEGKVTLLFFFTTWCPYCTAEAPFIEKEVWRPMRERGVQVVAIDVLEDEDLVRRLVERFDWTFPVLLDKEGKVTGKFAPEKEGLPPEVAIINSHFILDRELRIRYYDYLNMERFDAHARATVAKLEEILEG